MIDTIDAVLDERSKTHGSFEEHAHVTQSLKVCMRSASSYSRLTCAQLEAIDMICHKLGRIAAGDPNHADHWIDIAGYAQLVARELT